MTQVLESAMSSGRRSFSRVSQRDDLTGKNSFRFLYHTVSPCERITR